ESELSGSPGRQRRRQRSHAPATTTTTTTAISTTTTLNQIGRRCSSFRLLVRFGLLGSLTTTAAAAGTTTTNNNNNNNNNNTNNNNTLSLVDGLPSCCAESAVAAHEGEEDSSWALAWAFDDLSRATARLTADCCNAIGDSKPLGLLLQVHICGQCCLGSEARPQVRPFI
ncbi:unnamed protein product, partial [Polarella glacialis]